MNTEPAHHAPIDHAFQDFVKACYPGHVSKTQAQEMRNCFFAGAVHVFGLMKAASELPEDEAIKVPEAIQRELDAFYEVIKERVKAADEIRKNN